MLSDLVVDAPNCAVDEFLDQHKIPYLKNHVIKHETYFKTGGKISTYILPSSERELILACGYLRKNGVDFKVIGSTSNVVLLDDIDYSIIISTKLITNIELSREVVTVGSGYQLSEFVRVAAINSATGFEGLEGIPGSIGGAVWMNAGAYGYSISDYLESVCYIAENGDVLTATKDDCNFSYRSSIFRDSEKIIVNVRFRLTAGDRAKISAKIEKYHIARHLYQEFSWPNLGSMISVKHDIYHEIFKSSKIYCYVYICAKLILKNPVVKFIRRKRPNNNEFNILLGHYIKTRTGGQLRYRPSRKGANIMIHDGSCAVEDSYKYLFLINDLVSRKFTIENEFIIGPGKPKDGEACLRLNNLINLMIAHGISFKNNLGDRGAHGKSGPGGHIE